MATYDLGKVVGENGAKGDDGNGISSITKSSTSGKIDTYTITYTNGDTDTFTVTNGNDGAKGDTGSKGDTGDTGNGISSISLLSTNGKVKTYRITYTNGNHFDFQVNDGADGSSASVTIVSSWSATTSDSKVPSEKLAKTSLDGKVDVVSGKGLSTNDFTNSYKSAIDGLSTVASSGSYNDLSNKPSIPSSSSDLSDGSTLVKKSQTSGLLKNDGSVMTGGTGSSNWAIGNHTHSAYVNPTKVTSWSVTPSDSNVVSEKLIKDSLDDKVSKSSTSGLLKNDGSVDTNSYLTTGSASSTYQTKLVSGTSIKTINNESLLGSGNITVGGGSSVDIVTAWESTPSDSKVPSEKLTKETINALNVFDIGQNNSFNAVCLSKDMDSDGQGMAFANAILIYNENNDKLYYDKNTNGDTDSGNELATMNDIPSLANYVQKSSTSGLLKNDGSIDTSSYITSSAISGMLTSSDIANNLTTTASGKVLDARQGKALADLIGDAITYINQ